MPFPHEAILGRAFTSALVDAYPHHSWPLATRDWGNASTRAEEKALPRMASCGKVSNLVDIKTLTKPEAKAHRGLGTTKARLFIPPMQLAMETEALLR